MIRNCKAVSKNRRKNLRFFQAKQVTQDVYYISADLATLQNVAWIQQQWEVARNKVESARGGLLIIDEVQKIPNWSNAIKALCDHDTRNKVDLSVMILSSSPLSNFISS